MTITLPLTSYQTWSAADRSATLRLFMRVTGSVQANTILLRMINDIANGLAGVAPTPAIDISGATDRDLCSLESWLQSFADISPTPAKDFVRPFVASLIAASAPFATMRRNDGHGKWQ